MLETATVVIGNVADEVPTPPSPTPGGRLELSVRVMTFPPVGAWPLASRFPSTDCLRSDWMERASGRERRQRREKRSWAAASRMVTVAVGQTQVVTTKVARRSRRSHSALSQPSPRPVLLLEETTVPPMIRC